MFKCCIFFKDIFINGIMVLFLSESDLKQVLKSLMFGSFRALSHETVRDGTFCSSPLASVKTTSRAVTDLELYENQASRTCNFIKFQAPRKFQVPQNCFFFKRAVAYIFEIAHF